MIGQIARNVSHISYPQRKVAAIHDRLEEGFRQNERYYYLQQFPWHAHMSIYIRSALHLLLKRKVVSEICSVPNCAYSQDEVKGKCIHTNLVNCIVSVCTFGLAAVQRKYESLRRQWKAEEREDFVELSKKTSLLKKYRSRRKRVSAHYMYTHK